MIKLALARINSFASEPGTGFPPGTAAPQELAFSKIEGAI
jgi:hypothetical protein